MMCQFYPREVYLIYSRVTPAELFCYIWDGKPSPSTIQALLRMNLWQLPHSFQVRKLRRVLSDHGVERISIPPFCSFLLGTECGNRVRGCHVPSHSASTSTPERRSGGLDVRTQGADEIVGIVSMLGRPRYWGEASRGRCMPTLGRISRSRPEKHFDKHGSFMDNRGPVRRATGL
jgi:hypothetical protein